MLSPSVAYQLLNNIQPLDDNSDRKEQPPDGDSKVKQDKHLSFQVGQKFRQGPVAVACLCFTMSGS